MNATGAPEGAHVGATTSAQSTADHVEQVLRDAPIAELGQALGGDGWAWFRCPRCPTPKTLQPRWTGDPWSRGRWEPYTAHVVDDVLWRCTRCGTATIWALRTIILNDPKAIARLLSRLEVDAA